MVVSEGAVNVSGVTLEENTKASGFVCLIKSLFLLLLQPMSASLSTPPETFMAIGILVFLIWSTTD